MAAIVSEPALRNHDGISRAKWHVLTDVTASHQVVEADAQVARRRAGRVAADDLGTVAGGIAGQTARLDYGIDHGHALAIGHGARLGRLADDAHLLCGEPTKVRTITVTLGSIT